MVVSFTAVCKPAEGHLVFLYDSTHRVCSSTDRDCTGAYSNSKSKLIGTHTNEDRVKHKQDST